MNTKKMLQDEFNIPNDGTFEEAIKKVRPNGLIKIDSGRYTLNAGVIIEKPLRIIGTDCSTTVIVSSVSGTILDFQTDGLIVIKNITVERSGNLTGDLLSVSANEVTITSCFFVGNNTKGEEYDTWCGIRIKGSTTGTIKKVNISHCRNGVIIDDFAKIKLSANYSIMNLYNGFLMSGNAIGDLIRNRSEGNEIGITFWQSSTGNAEKNICKHNRSDGIRVEDKAEVSLFRNRCEKNERNGITFKNYSTGTAIDNFCRFNEHNGIEVADHANADLSGNTCEKNWKYGSLGDCGILIKKFATSKTINNICIRNMHEGIRVEDHANALLSGNRCEKNYEDGIQFFDFATGTAENNVCLKNNNGIHVQKASNIQLISNSCEDNKTNGIMFFVNGSGTATNNTCSLNGYNGIQVNDNSKANLIGNKCEKNENHGIYFVESATGTANNNICLYNNKNDIYVQCQENVTLCENQCEEITYGMRYVLKTIGGKLTVSRSYNTAKDLLDDVCGLPVIRDDSNVYIGWKFEAVGAFPELELFPFKDGISILLEELLAEVAFSSR